MRGLAVEGSTLPRALHSAPRAGTASRTTVPARRAWRPRCCRLAVPVVLVAALLVAPLTPARAGHVSNARWRQVANLAVQHLLRLPLSPTQVFVAADAAAQFGNPQAAAALLSRLSQHGPLAQVAEVEMALLVVDADPARALDVVFEVLHRPETSELRDAAVAVAERAVSSELDAARRTRLELLARRLPRQQHRRLELRLAYTDPDPPARRHRLDRLLAASAHDLVALEAAQTLLAAGELTVLEKWKVAGTLYRHALYADAEPLLEELVEVEHRGIPVWEVAFLRGRCAFRRGRWLEAATWYGVADSRASSRERRADLHVHLARALELDGKLGEAIAFARRAVLLRSSDERRLFLARLRLRNNQPDLAQAGLARIRSSTARARGEILLALDERRRGKTETAMARLRGIRNRRWQGPAEVLAARIATESQRWDLAAEILLDAAGRLDTYWSSRARELTGSMPETLRQALRARRANELGAGAAARRANLARWSVLDSESLLVSDLRARVAADLGLETPMAEPEFGDGLAASLWQLGLSRRAAVWDPDGFPRDDASELIWTAATFLALGEPTRAIRTADAAWRRGGADIDVRAYPEQLALALYPLPHAELVRSAAAAGDVPWPLLAGVVREESRWNEKVLSVVGARGLTQLMPATAAGVAADSGEVPPTPEELFDPAVGLTLGARELGRLVEAFDGRHAPAVAAYNAGQAQAELWLEQCGTPCSEEEYVLGISFNVTRAYTADVLASARFYDSLYGTGNASETASETAVTVRTGSPRDVHGPGPATARSPG